MKKEKSAGMKAGAIAAFLFPLLLVLLFVLLEGEAWQFFVRYMIAALAKGGWSVSPELILVIVLLGEIILGLLLAGVGAVLGIMFVRIKGNLPFQSTYAKAILCDVLIFILYSLQYFLRWQAPDPLLFGVFVIDAIIFAYLFNHWTKT